MHKVDGMRRLVRLLFLIPIVVFGGVSAAAAQQMIGSCPVLPANNIWNTPIDTVPVLSNSAAMVTTIGASRGFHADFGAGIWDGAPDRHPVHHRAGVADEVSGTFTYDDESDPGPYAVPLNAPIEGGSSSSGDRHAIAVDTDNCILYELYNSFPQAASWQADAGAIYNLQVERAPSVDMDVRRRRRSPDHARARDLRRAAHRRDQARHPLHRAADAA